MEKRKEIIKSLIEIDQDISQLIAELSSYPWDSEPLVVLTRQNIVNALNKYLNDSISASELENWANAIEMRDDIDYELGYENIIIKILTELATPELYEPINKGNIDFIISQIEKMRNGGIGSVQIEACS